MITQLQKGKNYFYQISLAMLVAMISIAGCTKKDETPKPTPVITDFKATSGWVGDVVTITGTDFGIDVANNIVKFGDKIATVSTATITELKVTVPVGATTGKISVTVNGVTGTSTTDFVVNTETVYICGQIYKNGKNIAGYWKNNTFVPLGDGIKNTDANGIVVIGNDIYVVGSEYSTTTSVAKYWKNGVSVNLSGVQNANATGIAVVGNDVYVAGTEIGSTLKVVAKYWKNGVATNLSDGSVDEYTRSIVVSSNDVYVLSATTFANGISKYWKNGTPVVLATNINNGTSLVTSNLVSMAIEGNDVYIGGSYSEGIRSNDDYASVYWKNGVRTSLSGGRIAALTVIGGVVHSAGVGIATGTTSQPKPKYWRNEVNTTLDSNQSTLYSFAEAITVIGSNVYVAGFVETGRNATGTIIYSPRYWKNGVGTTVGNIADDARVTGIVVIP